MALFYEQSHFPATLWSVGLVVGWVCQQRMYKSLGSPKGFLLFYCLRGWWWCCHFPEKLWSAGLEGGRCALPTSCAHIGQVLVDISHHHPSTPDGLLRVIQGDGNVTFQQHCGQLGGLWVCHQLPPISGKFLPSLFNIYLKEGAVAMNPLTSANVREVLADHS